MPTYVYACTECDHRFEAQQAFTDDALTECPNCGGKLRKVFNSVGIVFKGSGFYRNDSRGSNVSATSGGSSENASSSSSAENKSSGSGDSGKSAASSDSKSSGSSGSSGSTSSSSSSSASTSSSSSGSAA